MATTTTTTTPQAPALPAGLPALDPRRAGEGAHEYGYRALLFAVTHGPEWVQDTAALALADHVFPAAISNPEIAPRALEVLQAVRTRITATLKRRALAPVQVAEVAPPAQGTAARGPQGPMAPLSPAPKGGPAAPQAVVPQGGAQAPQRPALRPQATSPLAFALTGKGKAPQAARRPAPLPALVEDPF